MNNTELENFMQAATELASSDSPIEGLKPLPQWFQEGYVCEKKTPKVSMHVGNTVIYSGVHQALTSPIWKMTVEGTQKLARIHQSQ